MTRTTLFLSLFLFGCSSVTPQQVATASQLATSVIDLSNLSPAQKQAALFGVAAVSQAYAGQTAPVAVLAQGAGNAQAGQAIVSTLPSGTMTQAQVNNLYAAAKLIK